MSLRRTVESVIKVASSKEPADLCIANAKILDIYNREFFNGDLLIKDGYIAGWREPGKGKAQKYVDAEGRYLVPGFIDSHVHIESSYLSPTEFSNLVTICGTTTVIADPHEICNVCGLDGLRYMLHGGRHSLLSEKFMIPSCVPATDFEHAGATILASDMEEMFSDPEILGLGEMMNYPGVVECFDFVMDKIEAAKSRGLLVDGHIPSETGEMLQAYVAAGIITDHESECIRELKEKVRAGLYLMLRQGSACRNLSALIGGVDKNNISRMLFCTDDRQPKSILEEGHINNNVRMAVKAGLDPADACVIASLNPSICYRLEDRGAIAPGKRADVLLLDDLKQFNPYQVYIKGECVAQEGRLVKRSEPVDPVKVSGRMEVKDFTLDSLRLKLKSDHVRIIKTIPGSVVTEKGEATVKVENGEWVRDPEKDILKIGVIERHHATGFKAFALIEGYGLKRGAIATSVAHDSHNIIVCGENDRDMYLAVKDLISIGGGQSVVLDGEVIGHLALPIAGLMTDNPACEVSRQLDELHEIAHRKLGVSAEVDPFMTLCFMALPVIPAYKLTDMGLFDVTTFSKVDLELE